MPRKKKNKTKSSKQKISKASVMTEEHSLQSESELKKASEKKEIEIVEPKTEAQTSINQLRKNAERGDAESQYLLGEFYMLRDLTGLGVFAIPWFEKSAAQGYSPAEARLGVLRLNQIVAKHKNVVKCINAEAPIKQILRLLIRAMKNGSELAQKYLGFCCYHGWGTKVNYSRALVLLKDLNDGSAQYYAGMICEGVESVEKNEREAIHHYNLAAEQGNKDAKERLQILVKPTFELLKKLRDLSAPKVKAKKKEALEEEELTTTDEEDLYEGDLSASDLPAKSSSVGSRWIVAK